MVNRLFLRGPRNNICYSGHVKYFFLIDWFRKAIVAKNLELVFHEAGIRRSDGTTGYFTVKAMLKHLGLTDREKQGLRLKFSCKYLELYLYLSY